MNNSRILVCLYSDVNFLALNILESLLSKNTQVVIITNNLKKWENNTVHLTNKSRFSITDTKGAEKLGPFNYSIFCDGFISKSNGYKYLKYFLENKYLETSKRLVVLPFETFSPKEDGFIDLSDNLGVIYIGDLIGPRLDLDSDLLANSSIANILTKRELSLAVGETFYPIFVSDAARVITKWLFSFGPYGKEIFLLGPQVSGTAFWAANQKIVNSIELNYDNKTDPRYIPKNFITEFIPTNLNFILLETYKWLSQKNSTKPIVLKVKRKFTYPKYFWPAVLTVVFMLLFPFLTITASVGGMYFSYKDFMSGSTDSAINKILIAKTLFVIANRQSHAFTYIPFAGRLYKETEYVSDIGQKVSEALVSGIPLIKSANTTFNNVLGDSPYDPSLPSREIADGMDLLYNNVSAIQAETLGAQDLGVLSAKLLINKISFDKIKNFFKQGKTLATNLPSLLGKNKRKTYLVLFQNNMELRPTGGFIGSFGLLTFDGGRMTDLTVNDVYSADGQLRGHVEPPSPIRDYLNEANWWLRDSNWDPDFPTSAKRAEWFLDKEMSQTVDGVIAIDLNAVAEILKITGPIFLADYNMDITSSNLYEKTQSEVQEKFFPGSHKKASFLTALSRNLVTEVEKIGDKQKLLVLRSFLVDFEERHIQAFMHDDTTQGAVSQLGWGGEVETPTCGDGCYADLVGIVEANFGDNKANYFITRKVDLEVNYVGNVLTRKLTLTFNNSANIALGPSGTYKVYIRAFIPGDSSLISTKTIVGDNESELPSTTVEVHGRKEVGVFTQILGGQNQGVEYIWATNPESSLSYSSYGLYIRKQAGVSNDPWHINFDTGNTSLTKHGVYTYNTVLARDFFSRFKI